MNGPAMDDETVRDTGVVPAAAASMGSTTSPAFAATRAEAPGRAAEAGAGSSAARLSWAETRALIRSDQDRLATHLQADSLVHRLYFQLLPGSMALLLHRLSRYAYLRGWTGCARCVALLALYLTRAEIPPTTSIGPGALISHATGVNLFGRIGSNLTISGNVAIGGGMGIDDIGGGPGYPVLGDHVSLAYGACVLGAVRIGDRARVGPGALVTFDVPADGLVLWDRPRVVRGMGARRS